MPILPPPTTTARAGAPAVGQVEELASLRSLLDAQQRIIAAGLDADSVMQVVVECARDVTAASAAVVEIAEADEMVHRATAGWAVGSTGRRMKIAESLSGLCLRSGEVLRSDDALLDPRVDGAAYVDLDVRSVLVIPLLYLGAPVGVLKVLSRRPSAFDDADARVLVLMSGFIAIAMTNASRHESATRSLLYDPLTGLANRVLVLDRIDHAVRGAARDAHRVAVLFIDIDGFKAVNDTLGHAVGDEVLRRFSAALSSAVRSSDTVGRFGGDEFLILCDPADAEVLRSMMERVELAIATATEGLDLAGVAVTASIGVAVGDHTAEPAELIARADRSMYTAKRLLAAEAPPR